MRVLLYVPDEGDRPGESAFDGCDYTVQLGWFDGDRHPDIFSGWFEQGTNHDCFESWRVDGGNVPVMWAPVLPLPCDTDGSPQGPDPQGLDGEAATAGAEGIAKNTGQSPRPHHKEHDRGA